MLSIILADLGKPELLVQDLSKPRSFWELEQEVQIQSGAQNVNQDVVQELTKAFQEPSTSKFTVLEIQGARRIVLGVI